MKRALNAVITKKTNVKPVSALCSNHFFFMEVNALNKPEFISGGGEAGQLMRSTNWSASPAGVPATWPQQLHTAILIILHSHVPMFVAWGPAGALLYNDACRPLVAAFADDNDVGARRWARSAGLRLEENIRRWNDADRLGDSRFE